MFKALRTFNKLLNLLLKGRYDQYHHFVQLLYKSVCYKWYFPSQIVLSRGVENFSKCNLIFFWGFWDCCIYVNGSTTVHIFAKKFVNHKKNVPPNRKDGVSAYRSVLARVRRLLLRQLRLPHVSVSYLAGCAAP